MIERVFRRVEIKLDPGRRVEPKVRRRVELVIALDYA